MARSNINVVMHNTSGKVGGLLVFRRWFGQTIIGRIPQRSSDPPTPAQIKVRKNFGKSVAYAKSVMGNPPLLALYKAKAGQGVSFLNLAISDFIRSPVIGNIDTGAYNGAAGDTIIINVSDDFKVNSVSISISDVNGNLVEQGNAMQSGDNNDWIYLVTVANAQAPGSRIIVKATDLPGNVTSEVRVL